MRYPNGSTLNNRLPSYAHLKGFEPLTIVLETIMIPFHYRCIKMFRKTFLHFQISSFLFAEIFLLTFVRVVGFEPTQS